MRLATGFFAAAFLCYSTVSANAQTQALIDPICPEAVPYVATLEKLKPNDEPQLTYDAAHAVQSAYETCARRYLSARNAEAQRYALTREAFYGIVAGRALVQLGRPADARRELEHDRGIAQDVVEASAPKSSRSRDDAQSVVSAANAELAKLSTPAPNANL